MKFSILHIGLAAAALTLAGCVGLDRSYGTAPEMEIADLDALPAPSGPVGFRLGPQQKLEIAVAGVDDLTGVFLTDGEGNLTFPLVGKLAVAGMLPDEASQLIADNLRGAYVRDPQVRVIPQDLPPLSISIGGEVETPGTYPAFGKLTLLRAINSAGGLSEYAKLDDVLIMRTVDGQNYIGLYSIGAIQRGNYPDPVLYPDDIVMVGDSPARRRLDNIISIALPVLSSTSVILNQVVR